METMIPGHTEASFFMNLYDAKYLTVIASLSVLEQQEQKKTDVF